MNYFTENGPSVANSYLITCKELTRDVTISAPENFKIFKNSASEDFENSVVLSPLSGFIISQIYETEVVKKAYVRKVMAKGYNLKIEKIGRGRGIKR
ncbi:MAG: hypothetical protein V4683_13895 [Bacteroidota bacterium]